MSLMLILQRNLSFRVKNKKLSRSELLEMLLCGANGAGAVRYVRVQKNSMKHKGKDNKN